MLKSMATYTFVSPTPPHTRWYPYAFGDLSSRVYVIFKRHLEKKEYSVYDTNHLEKLEWLAKELVEHIIKYNTQKKNTVLYIVLNILTNSTNMGTSKSLDALKTLST